MDIDKLVKMAWTARDCAHPWKSKTKVGCAIQTSSDEIMTGYNIEGLWMTSIHAEVVAISKLVSLKGLGIGIAIVAETESFTPCGACIDWLMQFCTKDAKVIVENKRRERKVFTLNELCPHYPIQ